MRDRKKCADCKRLKAFEDFPRNRSRRDGREARCKPCHNARNRETVRRLYGNSRHYHLMQRFGVSAAEVEQMIKDQDGLCALCKRKPAVQVDHEHTLGRRVRGILCDGCNGGLGAFSDRPELLRRAIDYLKGEL